MFMLVLQLIVICKRLLNVRYIAYDLKNQSYAQKYYIELQVIINKYIVKNCLTR